MGMYTEFVFGCELKKDTPIDVINILKYIFNGEGNKDKLNLPNHPFFTSFRWRIIAHCSSYYFGYSKSLSNLYYDDISNRWKFAIRSSIKNYECEIENFIDWIRPYIEEGSGWPREFLGYSIYEEDEHPKLYYLKEG